VTCPHYLWPALIICDLSTLSWPVQIICDLSTLSVTCHHYLWPVQIISDLSKLCELSTLSVTCPHYLSCPNYLWPVHIICDLSILCDLSTLSVTWPHYLINSTISKEEKKFLKIKGLFIFSTTFVWNISHSKKNWLRYDTNCISVGLHVKYNCSGLNLIKLEFSQQIFQKNYERTTCWRWPPINPTPRPYHEVT
jgi:hypothetical protein